MTEKGYKIISDNLGEYSILRSDNTIVVTEIENKTLAELVVDELNELHEENHQLKRQIGNLEHTRDFCAECCERLEKENEQLKSEIRAVRGEYEQLWMHKHPLWCTREAERIVNELKQENEQLKSTIKDVVELLSEEVDLFSNKATEHDICAYIELRELDNKDAYYMAISTKKAIQMLKELEE